MVETVNHMQAAQDIFDRAISKAKRQGFFWGVLFTLGCVVATVM